MRKLYALLIGVVMMFNNVIAQAPIIGTDCGEYRFPASQCLTPQQSADIKIRLRQQQATLRQQGVLPNENDPSQRVQATSFAWPLRPAASFTDPGYYGISNYVDANPAYPNQLRDYNCGTRTYDQSNGYNHAGTDIFTWPYPQLKQQNNEVEIIAAAPGIIINKNDGSPDQSCALCSSCLWNAVYVQHADGSVAWYGHMKNGSVTTKAIGQTVALGEKLGVVGSSGNSTGPHLHFEVYVNAAQTQLVDPWQGTCNTTGGTLYNAGINWTAQKPYRESMINRIQVGKLSPSWGACPALESPNVATYFSPGNPIYMTAFYRDQLAGVVSSYKVVQPDGVIWSQWTHSSATTYNASYWFWSNTLPANAMSGIWSFQVQYSTGPIVSTSFTVGPPLPISLLNFTVKASSPCKASIEWTTATETNNKGFHIQRSDDGITFRNAGWVAGAGNSVSQIKYGFSDAVTGSNCKKMYYRLQQEDADGKTSISKTVAVQWAASGSMIAIFPNPARDKITIQGENLKRAMLLDATGRTLAQINLQGYITPYSVASLQPGKYTLQLLHADGRVTVEQFLKN